MPLSRPVLRGVWTHVEYEVSTDGKVNAWIGEVAPGAPRPGTQVVTAQPLPTYCKAGVLSYVRLGALCVAAGVPSFELRVDNAVVTIR